MVPFVDGFDSGRSVDGDEVEGFGDTSDAGCASMVVAEPFTNLSLFSTLPLSMEVVVHIMGEVTTCGCKG